MSAIAMEAAAKMLAPSPTAKLVLFALAYFHDGLDCWPSRDDLSDVTGLKERAIHDAIGNLVDAALISRFRRRDPTTRLPASDGFVLLFAHGSDLRPPRQTRDYGLRLVRGVQGSELRQEQGSNHAPDAGFRGETAPNATDSRERARSDDDDSIKKPPESGVSQNESARARELAVAVWQATPPRVQALCRAGIGGVTRMIREAMSAGDDLTNLPAAVAAYYAKNPKTDRVPNYLIRDGDWKEAAPAPTSDKDRAFAEKWAAEKYGGPPGHPAVGKDDDPGPALQWSWLIDWCQTEAPLRHLWIREHGPAPGEDGSRVWSGLLEAFRKVNPGAAL